jgi:cyanophycinase-like exopeptidase
MATARVDDVERTVFLANDMNAAHDASGPICLLQCGRPSALAAELTTYIQKLGRRVTPLVISDRAQAQSDSVLGKVAAASAVWVFADDLLETFFTVLATPLAFALRAKSKAGLPVVGFGSGALALGGLMLAHRVCRDAHHDLVSGLGWAPRVMLDVGGDPFDADAATTRATIASLPGLLGVDLGQAGAVRVAGGRVESIGTESIVLLGGGGDAVVLMLELEPGQVTTIAPPPFAPFERDMLPPDTVNALTREMQAGSQRRTAAPTRAAPVPNELRIVDAGAEDTDHHTQPGSLRLCPMCKKVHGSDPTVALAA